MIRQHLQDCDEDISTSSYYQSYFGVQFEHKAIYYIVSFFVTHFTLSFISWINSLISTESIYYLNPIRELQLIFCKAGCMYVYCCVQFDCVISCLSLVDGACEWIYMSLLLLPQHIFDAWCSLFEVHCLRQKDESFLSRWKLLEMRRVRSR